MNQTQLRCKQHDIYALKDYNALAILYVIVCVPIKLFEFEFNTVWISQTAWDVHKYFTYLLNTNNNKSKQYYIVQIVSEKCLCLGFVSIYTCHYKCMNIQDGWRVPIISYTVALAVRRGPLRGVFCERH